VKAVRGIVSGRVQRVWYRGSIKEAARALGITGYAKNLPDGTVEVLLCGTDDGLQKGKEAALRGSPGARVTGIRWQDVVLEEAPERFEIL
jgi:acylphosphatase